MLRGLNFQPFFATAVLRRQEGALSGPLDMGDKIKALFHRSEKLPYQFSITAHLANEKRRHDLHGIFRPSAQLSDLDPRTFGQFSSNALAIRNSASSSTSPWEATARGLRLRGPEMPNIFIGEWTSLLSAAKRVFDVAFPFPPGTPSEQPFKLGAYHDILAHRQPDADLRVFSYLKRYGLLSDFVREMRETFHELKDIDAIPYPDGTQGPVYVRTNDDRGSSSLRVR
jgi:hypothetical protein